MKHIIEIIKNNILISIALVLVLGQLTRIELTKVLVFYPHDLLIGIYLLLSVYQFLSFTKTKQYIWRKFISKPLVHRLLQFVGWLGLASVIKMFFSGETIFFLHFVRLAFYCCFLLIISQKTIRSVKVTSLLQNLPIFIGITALSMYIVSPDMRVLSSLGWDDHYYRLVGPLLDPNFTGIILSIGAILGFRLIITTTKNKIVNWSKLILLLGAVGLTFSRSSFLALSCGLIYFVGSTFIKNKTTQIVSVRRLFFTLAASILIISSAINFSPKPGGDGVKLTRTYSVWSRASYDQQWTNFNSIALLDWLIGPAQTPHTSTHAQLPNNIVISIFAWSGPIGLFLFTLFLIQLYKKSRHQPWLVASILALFVFNQTNSATEPFVLLITGLTLISTNMNLKIKPALRSKTNL